MSPPSPATDGSSSRLALTAGLGCFTIWGFMALIFQAMGALGATPWEILAHRTFWALPAAGLFVLLARQAGQVAAVLRNPKVMAWLALSSALIAVNWIVFIWAANTGRVLETSLGYYINPLLNMAVGALVFRERVDRFGVAAMALAALGVVLQTVALGQLPWVSLFLALTFGGYGLVRKQVAADAQTGLFIECLLLGLPGLIFIAWLQHSGQGHFGQGAAITAWMIAAGPITAVPLVLFAWCARRLPLSTMGFIQFLTPTISFAIGVAEGEAFTPARAASFALIWAGVALFLWSALRGPAKVAVAE